MKELPSYVCDSSHLINLIRNLRIPKDSILATLDVTSLYTNIPNDEGIEAIGGYLSIHRHYSLNPTNSSLLQLLRIVLTTNNFKFDNKDFLQVGGTAMGTKLALHLLTYSWVILTINSFTHTAYNHFRGKGSSMISFSSGLKVKKN